MTWDLQIPVFNNKWYIFNPSFTLLEIKQVPGRQHGVVGAAAGSLLSLSSFGSSSRSTKQQTSSSKVRGRFSQGSCCWKPSAARSCGPETHSCSSPPVPCGAMLQRQKLNVLSYEEGIRNEKKTIFRIIFFLLWAAQLCLLSCSLFPPILLDFFHWSVFISQYPFQACSWNIFKHCLFWIFNESVIFCSVFWFVRLCVGFFWLHFCILGRFETLSTFLFLTAYIWCLSALSQKTKLFWGLQKYQN